MGFNLIKCLGHCTAQFELIKKRFRLCLQPLLFLVKPQTINVCLKQGILHFSPQACAACFLLMQRHSQNTWSLQAHWKGFRVVKLHSSSKEGYCLCLTQSPQGWLFPNDLFLCRIKGATVFDRCLYSALCFCCAELHFYFPSEVNWSWQINYQRDALASLVYDKYVPTIPLCIPDLEGFLKSAAINHVQARLYWGRKKKTVCKPIVSCTDNLISRIVFSFHLALFLVWCFFGFFFCFFFPVTLLFLVDYFLCWDSCTLLWQPSVSVQPDKI